jgi:F0F1-type ATP synthase membrane subunit b/b'
MLAFFFDFLILLAASGGEGSGGFMDTYNKYLNYPGLEAWKFINLAIFVAIMAYVLKKPLGEAFKARREKIRAELIRAEEERKSALAKLTSAEARLASLDNERQLVLNRAKLEADAEAARILEQTESEVAKLREQTEGEVARLTQQTKVELKRYSAEESIRRAEAKLRSSIDANADANLVKSGIQAIGGLS